MIAVPTPYSNDGSNINESITEIFLNTDMSVELLLLVARSVSQSPSKSAATILTGTNPFTLRSTK